MRFFIISFLFLSACASSTEDGSKQLLLVPSEQIVAMSAEAYQKTLQEAQQKGTLDKNPDHVRRTQAIAKRLAGQSSIFRKDATSWAWEVHVITNPELNAYCMPGGKIIFYTGIIDNLKLTDNEIAAIMGHEIAHALREHGRERMSEELMKQVGLQVLVATGKLDPKYAGAINVVSTLARTLPHGRGQELEADEMGMELMARAGYNPAEAITLWKKMEAAGGGKPPEILSTHPSDKTRIAKLESLLPKMKPIYDQAVR